MANNKITLNLTLEEFALMECALVNTRDHFQKYNSCNYFTMHYGSSSKIANLYRLYTNLIIKYFFIFHTSIT